MSTRFGCLLLGRLIIDELAQVDGFCLTPQPPPGDRERWQDVADVGDMEIDLYVVIFVLRYPRYHQVSPGRVAWAGETMLKLVKDNIFESPK